MERGDMMKSMRRSARDLGLGFMVGVGLCVFLGPCSGCKWFMSVINQSPRATSRTEVIVEEEQNEAQKIMAKIFSSAQNSFAHKSNGIMACSIEELGDGFTIGKYGALIYEEIWAARITCPKEEADERANNSVPVKKMLERPYRYGVMKVQGISSKMNDNLTTCIVAVPANDKVVPALVMLAGPVERDPQDFMKTWPVARVDDLDTVRKIREWVSSGKPFDMEKKKLLFK